MSETLSDQLRRRRAAAARLEPIEIEGRAGLHRDPCAPHLHRRSARPESIAAVAEWLGPHCALVLAGGNPDLLREALQFVSIPDARGELSRHLTTLERGCSHEFA